MYEDDDAPLLFEHRAKNGEILSFDISRSACEPFGFYYGDRVETPLGHASVVGARDKCLWFLVDGDRGASFWDTGKNYETLIKVGISLLNVAPDKKGYKVKTVSYNSKNTAVVLQNENGPCPLLGISNVLALRGDITIEGEGSNKNIVTLETLIEKLSSYLLDKNIEKGEDALMMVEKATKVMPQLQYGLDVNFNFKECDNFEKTDQCKLFELFNIRLVHGWLVDHEDLHTTTVIGNNTYNDLMNKLVALDTTVPQSSSNSAATTPPPSTQSPVHQPAAGGDAQPPITNQPPLQPSVNEQQQQPPQQQQPQQPQQQQQPLPEGTTKSPKKAEEPVKPPTEQDYQEGAVISHFLNSTQSQLTATGLTALHNLLKEREMCVFFRNNHFSTLTKRDGRLYILVTDIGYERERNIVWDLLSTVDGSSVFCNGDFQSADNVTREEVVNTLDLMGFSKTQIDECLPMLTREEMSNPDTAIEKAVAIMNKKTQPMQQEGEVRAIH